MKGKPAGHAGAAPTWQRMQPASRGRPPPFLAHSPRVLAENTIGVCKSMRCRQVCGVCVWATGTSARCGSVCCLRCLNSCPVATHSTSRSNLVSFPHPSLTSDSVHRSSSRYCLAAYRTVWCTSLSHTGLFSCCEAPRPAHFASWPSVGVSAHSKLAACRNEWNCLHSEGTPHSNSSCGIVPASVAVLSLNRNYEQRWSRAAYPRQYAGVGCSTHTQTKI